MNLPELIRRFRVMANDRQEPYLWDDQDVIAWLNDAQAQACIRGRLILEDADPDICSVALTSGVQVYPLHPAVYELVIVILHPVTGNAYRLNLVSREWLDANEPEWRTDTNPARYVIQGETSLRVVGSFETGAALALECYRTPTAAMTLPDPLDPDIVSDPEIHLAHHEHLIDWALYRAYSVPDSETLDPARAALAEEAFTRYFGPLPDNDLRRATRHDVVHRNVPVIP